jgi:thioester reductase-like protein
MSPVPFSLPLSKAGLRLETVIDFLEHWASVQPDRCLYSFLDENGQELESYTYLAFHERTRQIAAHLVGAAKLRRGDRALLVYSPGLEFIAAFFACARAGVLPVPVYPPTPMNFEGGLKKLTFIARDCAARAALTTRGFYRSYQLLLARRKISSLKQKAPPLPKLKWVTTDDIRGVAAGSFANNPDEILFLQYTSGSTSDPKGVIATHENIIHNCESTLDHSPVCVSWLPQYHDMGLIGYYLYPLITGGTTYGFAPLNFLKRPEIWLQTISRVRATYTSSPNFGLEYCLREDKVSDEQLDGVDLSSLRVLMNAAEPVRAETHLRFLERFSEFGLRPEAHVVAYGLAENTLAVSHHGKQVVTVNKRQMQRRQLHFEPGSQKNNNQLRIVSCGKPLAGVHVRIVNPETREALREHEIGEIWLAGKSTCRGYWNRPELTSEQFGCTLANDPAAVDRYLRTGDLGFFHEGELFVCGRIKDLIIIHGVNYYPQDIESIVESASKQIRTGCTVAFDVDEGGELLVVVAEVKRTDDLPDPAEITRAIRTQYYIEPQTIAFVRQKSIPKTTSGKLSRSRARELWLAGEMQVIAAHVSSRRPQPVGAPSDLRQRFQYIIELYNLTGREEYTFVEIGIDSLTMVQLLNDIKRLLEEHGAGALVNEVDIRLLQRLTIAEFFSLLDQFEKTADEPLAALKYVLRRIQKEHESYERDCMRADAKLEPLLFGPETTDLPVRNVLLTGATGFFGPFLLRGLLNETPYIFHILTRATDPVHGLDRVRAALRRARVWTPELEGLLEERVRIVCGDLAQHNLGLRSAQWQALTNEVQAVCHNGAMVNYVLSYDALRPHNVDGTRELLRFAASGVRKEFHLVSSSFIFGWTVKGVLRETDGNSGMENLDFGYAQSKWVAERLAFAAEKQGLKVRVYRPSLLSAATGGAGSRDDIVVRLLAFMIKYGVAVKARNQISLLPADIAAENIAKIFAQRRAGATTYHVTVDGYYNMMDVTGVIAREYGYAFKYFEIPDFIAQMNRLCSKEDPLYPLVDFFNRSHEKLAAMQHKRYDNEQYRMARAASPNGRSEPPLVETVAYLVDFMLREEIIPNPPLKHQAAEAVTLPLKNIYQANENKGS